MRRIITILVTTFFCNIIIAQQGEPFDGGSWSAALGGQKTTISGKNALLTNFSAFSNSDDPVILISTKRRFNLSELTSISLAGAKSLGSHSFGGISIQSYGFDLYRESKYAVHYGRSIKRNHRIALTLNYNTLSIDEYGSEGVLGFEIGLSGQINRNLKYGIKVANPERLDLYAGKKLDSYIAFGLNYQLSDVTSLYGEVEKVLDETANARLGISFRVNNKFSIIAGFSTYPSTFNFGFELSIAANSFLQGSFQYSNLLGTTPNVTLIHVFAQNAD